VDAEEAVEYSDWQRFERVFSEVGPRNATSEIIFGRRLQWRYWTLTNDPVALPDNSTWQVMSHLKDKQDHF